MGHSAVVLGASGYSGGELLRLLMGHPSIEVAATAGGRSAGRPLSEVHPHLGGTDLSLVTPQEAAGIPCDVLFSCLPHGELAAAGLTFAADHVIDLADDHRAAPGWVYGLPEYQRALLPARSIANPGCYPTASLLALVPFARAGAIGAPVVIDAMSGVSGAGRKSEDHLSFSAMDGDMSAYGSIEHRHVPEIERALARFGNLEATVSFTPHLVPLVRGLLVTARAQLTTELDDTSALGILHDAFDAERFVRVVDGWPSTKPVAGSNGCHVSAHVDARNGWLIASAAIDNLGKGAAGQAIQNANLCLGLDESTGLSTAGVWP